MSKVDDGGPAFPNEGMSLRDYFAGQALAAMLIAAPEVGGMWSAFADDAYDMADAMLRSRREGSDQSITNRR